MASQHASKPPATLNKQGRASFAKDTINNHIPHILKWNDRARDAIKKAELIHYSPSSTPAKHAQAPAAVAATSPASTSNLGHDSESNPSSSEVSKPAGDSKVVESLLNLELKIPKIRVIQSDTYDAVEVIIKSTNSKAKVAALNMASAIQPGGGVLNGAMAQEESLCMRSTLYHTLDHYFYRIPDRAAIYSPDVLVFRNSDNQDMPKADWYYTNVISCAAIKGPDVTYDKGKGYQYEYQEDYELMITKVRLIIQIAKAKGITHLVLGALGCGAYRNPPMEVAKIFKKVLLGDRKRPGVTGMEEIVFAIFDDGPNLAAFMEVFGDGAGPS